MKRNKIFLFIIFSLLVILLLSTVFSSCSNNQKSIKFTSSTESSISETTSTQKTEAINQTKDTEESITEGTNYLDFYEGLHITGTPIDVDINTYRLKIIGAVDKELSLTFDEIKNIESVREDIELICPGFFVDKGYWTGVPVIELLNMAGIKEEAKKVEFISIDGSYKQTLPIEKLDNEGFLISYQFNDKEFSKYHGYPLRLVAKGEAGSYWVKWLGEIKVISD